MKPVKFYCSDCDSAYSGFPEISSAYPDVVFNKIIAKAADRVHINDDVCRTLYPKPKRSFVRANLDIPIIGESEPLQYGLWVDLTENSGAGRYPPIVALSPVDTGSQGK